MDVEQDDYHDQQCNQTQISNPYIDTSIQLETTDPHQSDYSKSKKNMDISDLTADNSTFDDYTTSDFALRINHSSPKRSIDADDNSALMLKDPFPNETFVGERSIVNKDRDEANDSDPVVHNVFWSKTAMDETKLNNDVKDTGLFGSSDCLVIDESKVDHTISDSVSRITTTNKVEVDVDKSNFKAVQSMLTTGCSENNMSTSLQTKVIFDGASKPTKNIDSLEANSEATPCNLNLENTSKQTQLKGMYDVRYDAKSECNLSSNKDHDTAPSISSSVSTKGASNATEVINPNEEISQPSVSSVNNDSEYLDAASSSKNVLDTYGRAARNYPLKRSNFPRIKRNVLRRYNSRELYVRRVMNAKVIKIGKRHNKFNVQSLNPLKKYLKYVSSKNATEFYSSRIKHRSKKSKSSLRVSCYLMKKNKRKVASMWNKERNIEGYNLRQRVPSVVTCSQHGLRSHRRTFSKCGRWISVPTRFSNYTCIDCAIESGCDGHKKSVVNMSKTKEYPKNEESDTAVGDFSHEINNLKAVLRSKYRVIRRSKNNKIGISRHVIVKVPLSKMCFQQMFKPNIAVLQAYTGGNVFCKLNIKDLDPVLGCRWNIGQSDTCSTQARIIGDVSLRYKETEFDVKQTSFNGNEGEGLDVTVSKDKFQLWVLTLKCEVVKENGRLQKKLRLSASN